MSNPDRPIAQPRRRLNRTTSTNSVGSVGSAPGSTSPMGPFGFNSPSSAASLTGAKPPVQPSFGSPFGAPAAASTTPTLGFNSGFPQQQQQQQQQPSTTLGFGGSTNLSSATNAPTSSMGFGGFGSPVVPSSTPASTSTTTTAPTFGGGFGMNTNSSPFGGASNIPTSASGGTGGFQSGFGSSSGGMFGGFGKPAQLQETAKTMDDNDASMDSDEQPPATSAAAAASSSGGFGSSKPATSVPAPATPFAGFSFGKPSTTPSAATSKPLEAPTTTTLSSPFSFAAPKDTADKNKPTTAAFSFGAPSNTAPTTSTMSFGTIKATTAAEEGKPATTSAPSPFAGLGMPSKTTPSPFAGFGNPIPSAKITEIHSPEGSDNEKDDSKPTEIVPAPKFSFTTPAKESTEGNKSSTTAAAEKPPTMSFGSFTSTSTEKKGDESSTFSTLKKTDVPPTFAGLKSASEVSSPSSVIANAASPAPTISTFESATNSISTEKETTSTTTPAAEETKKEEDRNATEKQAAPRTSLLFGQQRELSATSTASDTSTQAVAAASPSPFATVTTTTKEADKSTTTGKTTSETGKPTFGGFNKSASTSSEGFSIPPGPSSFFGKPAGDKTSDTVVIEDNDEDTTEKEDKKPAFSFGGKPFTKSTTDKPATSAPSFSFNQPAKTTDKPSPFAGFNLPPASTTSSDKPAPAKPFSFATSTPSDKQATPKPFSFNSPATTSTDKPAAPAPTFSFNVPSAATTTTSSSSASRKKRDRDSEDENDQDEQQSHKKSFSVKSKADAATSSPFSFSMPGSKDASPFTFGPTPVKKSDTEGSKEPTVVPTFKFGATPAATEKKDSSGIFTFGATPAAAATTTTTTTTSTSGSASSSKESTEKKSFSFDSPTSASTLKKTFNFGAPPESETTADSTSKDKSTTDANNSSKTPLISFGATPAAGTATPSPFGSSKSTAATAADKTKDTTTATSKTPDTSKGIVTKVYSKCPLFNLTFFMTNEAGGKEGEGEKSASASSGPSTTKKVSFNLSDASLSSASSFGSSFPTATKPSEPASASLAFSKVKGTEDVTEPSTLNLLSSAEKDTSSSGVALQTTLKSSITEVNQITYKTRFWELPDEARNELAQLAHFITEQTDKKEKIDQELGSYFGSALKEVHASAITVNEDALILGEKLEVQSKAIDDLILLNKEQRLNAAAASNVLQQDSRNWRMRGASENLNFFKHAIINMEERMNQLSETVSTVEQAVDSYQPNLQFSPQHIGAILGHQSKMYMSLAGRVAEIHQEADRVVKRRKLTK
ncbi:alanine transaminase [Mucor velutinosus]|uniref:Alanine transaminase n=1 Tax=Mucor velutinosus TaxID=708070 RepID=A0AAN7HZ79_9FUNG|nr:alanine transaminase [Mucor velutinosus]